MQIGAEEGKGGFVYQRHQGYRFWNAFWIIHIDFLRKGRLINEECQLIGPYLSKKKMFLH